MRRLVAYIHRSCMLVRHQLFWNFQKLFEKFKNFLKIQKLFEKFKKIFLKKSKTFWKNQKFFEKFKNILKSSKKLFEKFKNFFWKFKNFFENSKTFLKFPKHVFLRFRAGTNYLRYAQDWGTRQMEYEKPVQRSLKHNTLLWRYLNTWHKTEKYKVQTTITNIDIRNMSDKLKWAIY